MELEGQRVGLPTGPCTDTDHLASPLSALDIIREVFTDDLELFGEIPEYPAGEPGAVY
jgi:hypothetical protein